MATTGNFGTVATDNPGAVTGYMWEESADFVEGSNPGTWADVGTSLLNPATISDQTTVTFTIDSATVGESGTYVRCRADFLDGATPTSSYSDAVLLTVT
jgi:hypothetical protein